MEKKSSIPPIVKFGAWLLALIAFGVGFWHAHLGLKSFNLFNSEYGSLAVAGIVLLLILLSYNLAVGGKKVALLFYIFGGLTFFVFNLNYFYPAYLGDKLVKEEAKEMNDSLQAYANTMKKFQDPEILDDYADLILIKDRILSEIRYQNGFGRQAKEYLNQFNQILSDNEKDVSKKDKVKITPSFAIGNTQEERDRMAEDLEYTTSTS